jgi:hypothetical protein
MHLVELSRQPDIMVSDQLTKTKHVYRTVAITPTKSRMYNVAEVKRVCQENTIIGLRTILEARPNMNPFRIIYMSGAIVERDQTKKPEGMLGDYMLMRVSCRLYHSLYDRADLTTCLFSRARRKT